MIFKNLIYIHRFNDLFYNLGGFGDTLKQGELFELKLNFWLWRCDGFELLLFGENKGVWIYGSGWGPYLLWRFLRTGVYIESSVCFHYFK